VSVSYQINYIQLQEYNIKFLVMTSALITNSPWTHESRVERAWREPQRKINEYQEGTSYVASKKSKPLKAANLLFIPQNIKKIV